MELHQLQKIQQEYDVTYWEKESSEFEKIRHITLHLGKLMGKISTYCERKEHNPSYQSEQIKDEVVPDLFFYALQLSNLLSLELEKEYLKRLEKNKKTLNY